MLAELSSVEGLGTREGGQAVLSGELLELERRLERVFLGWAARWQAREYRFPEVISAAHLDRLDYFQSFPHLATFPVTLGDDAANLERFAQRSVPADGELTLSEQAPLRDVLTPAACYHVYVELENQRLAAPRYITTRATCYRRECTYAPLQRQWTFSMREIVCVGSSREVERFLADAKEIVSRFSERIGLRIRWETATDPFFCPKRSPKYLFQRLEPVKQEMVFEQSLALGSTNSHRQHFGEAFGIERDGEAAHSGCVAFGLERWLYAFLSEFGPRAADWPPLEAEDA